MPFPFRFPWHLSAGPFIMNDPFLRHHLDSLPCPLKMPVPPFRQQHAEDRPVFHGVVVHHESVSRVRLTDARHGLFIGIVHFHALAVNRRVCRQFAVHAARRAAAQAVQQHGKALPFAVSRILNGLARQIAAGHRHNISRQIMAEPVIGRASSPPPFADMVFSVVIILQFVQPEPFPVELLQHFPDQFRRRLPVRQPFPVDHDHSILPFLSRTTRSVISGSSA